MATKLPHAVLAETVVQTSAPIPNPPGGGSWKWDGTAWQPNTVTLPIAEQPATDTEPVSDAPAPR